MNKIILLTFALFSLSLWSQEKLKGNKNVIKEDREVEFFNHILVKNDIEVIISQDDVVSVSVEADENLHPAIETKVSGETLSIYLSQTIKTSKELKVYVRVSQADITIETRDKAKISATEEMKFEFAKMLVHDRSKQFLNLRTLNAEIVMESSANAELTLNAEEKFSVITEQNASLKLYLETKDFEVLSNNGSNIKPTGNCKNMTLSAHDNGKFSGKEFLIDNAVVNASDRSDVSVNVAKSIEISAENDAEIYIYDNPKYDIKKFADKATLHKK